ncbi:MAG: UPF0175 family protein [bacterium]
MIKTRKLIRTNVMLDKGLVDSIDEFADIMEEDRSSAIRQLIRRAITEEKMDIAVKKFQEGISFRKAVELAGVDYWDFQMELDKRGIAILSSLPLAQRRMKK